MIDPNWLLLWMQGLVFLLGIGYLYLIIWGYRDARLRGASGWAIALVMVILGPIGYVYWNARRPPIQNRQRSRPPDADISQ